MLLGKCRSRTFQGMGGGLLLWGCMPTNCVGTTFDISIFLLGSEAFRSNLYIWRRFLVFQVSFENWETLEKWPESLGAMLKYWYIKLCLLKTVTPENTRHAIMSYDEVHIQRVSFNIYIFTFLLPQKEAGSLATQSTSHSCLRPAQTALGPPPPPVSHRSL